MAGKFTTTCTVRIPMEGKPNSIEIMNDGDTVTIGIVYRDNDHFQCFTAMSKDEFVEVLHAAGLSYTP
jgi:hypothetical protein